MPTRLGSTSGAGNVEATNFFRATKKRQGAFTSDKSPLPAKMPTADSADYGEGLSAYEKMRMEKIQMNSRMMSQLGIESITTSMRKSTSQASHKTKTTAKRKRKQPPRRRTDDSDSSHDFSENESSTDSDFETEVKKSKVTASVRTRTDRVARKTAAPPSHAPSSANRRSSTRAATKYAGMNLKMRRIKVSVFTEDTGKEEWHHATIIASRTKNGRLEHLVKWDTVDEEDEWLSLEDETHYLFDEGEKEGSDSEEEDEEGWKVGQNVEVHTEGDEQTSIARLVENLGDGKWTVGWYAEVEEVPRQAWKSNEFVSGKDIFYTVHRQELPECCFKGAVDIVCTTAAYRTVREGQRLCRYLWDPRRCYLHRLTLDGKWLPALGKEVREMLLASNQRNVKLSRDEGEREACGGRGEGEGEAEVDAVAVPGRTGGKRKQGPELSDSESDAEEEEDEEEDEEGGEEEAAEAEGGEGGEGGGAGLSSAGGYWAALAGASANKAATLGWGEVEVAEEARVAACMQRLPRVCGREMAGLHACWRGRFGEWREALLGGFNLCFYGFGSKRGLLREFVEQEATWGPVVEVSAFVPGLRLRRVLGQVLEEVLGVGGGGGKPLGEQVRLIVDAVWRARVAGGLEREAEAEGGDAWEAMMEALSRAGRGGEGGGEAEGGEAEAEPYAERLEPRRTRGMADGTARCCQGGARHLTLLIHSIESPALQSAEAQEALATLAAAPGIHIVASVDHVNAALAWSPTLRGRMRWAWADLTTLERYCAESPYAAGGAGGGGEEQGHSALVVLRSLNKNAKGVFGLLVAQQLRDGAGLPFAALYERARERFLVSSELSLRNHLTEMKDHKILRERSPGAAGAAKQLYVPLPVEALRGILAELRDNAQLQRVLGAP